MFRLFYKRKRKITLFFSFLEYKNFSSNQDLNVEENKINVGDNFCTHVSKSQQHGENYLAKASVA